MCHGHFYNHMFLSCCLVAYSIAQMKLDARTQSPRSASEDDISSMHYKHAGVRWNFSHVKQSLFVMCASVLKIPAQAIHYQVHYAQWK